MEIIAVAIILHLHESWHRREIDIHSLELEFMIGGVLTLANDKAFDRKSVIKFDCRQRINLIILTNILQIPLMLKKRKTGD